MKRMIAEKTDKTPVTLQLICNNSLQISTTGIRLSNVYHYINSSYFMIVKKSPHSELYNCKMFSTPTTVMVSYSLFIHMYNICTCVHSSAGKTQMDGWMTESQMNCGMVHILRYWKQSERLPYPWQPAFKSAFHEEKKRKKRRLGRERAPDRFNYTNYSKQL